MEPEIINPTSFLSEFSKSQKTVDTKDVLPYEFDQGMGELNKYDVGLTPYIPKEENRAQNQDWWQSTRNSLSQLVSGTIGEIVATPGYIAGTFEPIEEMDKGISGLFIEAGEWIKQQGQEFAPLYQSQASREKIFAPWDSEWMAQTIADFGPTVALVASAFFTEGLTTPRLLSLGRQIPGISKYARAAQIFKNESKIYNKLRTVNTTLFNRMAENGMEAYQTFNEVYDGLKSSNPEMSDEDMRKLAGEAGSKVWRENWALIVLDYMQFDGLLNGFGKLGKAIGVGQQMASGAFEEGLQYTMQAEAKNEIDFKTGKADRDKTFVETFIEGLTDPEMQKAMVQGALGGAVFQGMGAIANKIGERYRQPLSQSTSEVVNDIVKRGYADVAKADIDKKIAETDDPKLKKHLEGVKASIDKAVEVHQSENLNKDETAKALIKTQVLNNEKTDIEQKIENKKTDTTIQNKSAVDYAKASLASPHLNTLRKKYSKFPKALSIIDKLEQKYNNQRDTLASPEVTDEATHLIPQMKVDVHKAVELELEEEIQKQVATDLAEGNRELHDNLVKEDVKTHISNYTDKEELLKLRESETDAENKKVINSRIKELWQSESKVFPTIEQGADVWAEHYRENLFTFKNDAKNLFKNPSLTVDEFKNRFKEFKPLLEERQNSEVADQKRAVSLEQKDKTKIIDVVSKDEKGLTIKQINQRSGKQDRTNLVEQLVNEGILAKEGNRYKKVEVEDDIPIIVEHTKDEPQPDDIPFDPKWARSNDMLFYAATEVNGKWYITYSNKTVTLEEYEKLGFDKPILKTGWYPVTKDKEPVKWHQTDVDVDFLRKVYEITGKPLDQHEVYIKVDWNYTNGNWKNRDANKDNFKIYYVIKHEGKEHIVGEVPAYKRQEEDLKSFRYTLYEHAKQESNVYEYPHTLRVKATRPGRVWNTKSRNSDLTVADRGINLGVYSDGKIYGIEQTNLDRVDREDIKSFEGKLTEGAVYWFITHPVTGKIVPIRLFTRKVKDLPNVEKKIKHILAGVNKDNWVDKRREVSRYVKWGTKEKRQPDFGFNKSGELIVNGEVTPIPDGAVIQDVIYDTLDIGDRTIQVDTRRINTKGYNEMLMNEGYIQTDVNQINPFHSPKFKVDYTELTPVEIKKKASNNKEIINNEVVKSAEVYIDAKDRLIALSKSGTDLEKLLATLILKHFNAFENVYFNVEWADDVFGYGVYDDKKVFYNGTPSNQIFLHELVHAITHDAIKKGELDTMRNLKTKEALLFQELNVILIQLQKKLGKNVVSNLFEISHSSQSASEFVASMSKPEMAKALLDFDVNQNTNFFERWFKAILDFLGVKNTNLLNTTVGSIEKYYSSLTLPSKEKVSVSESGSEGTTRGPALTDINTNLKAPAPTTKNEPTRQNVTERLNINSPFYKKVSKALSDLGLIEEYNPETKEGDVLGGYIQVWEKGFVAGDIYFNSNGSVSYIKGDVKVVFDSEGNLISENTKEAKQKATQIEIEGKKESIARLEKLRDSDAFTYKEVTETDLLGNKRKVKRLKTPQELKESTDKINATIDKVKSELAALETSKPLSAPVEVKDQTSTDIEAKKADIERRRKEELEAQIYIQAQDTRLSVGFSEEGGKVYISTLFSGDSSTMSSKQMAKTFKKEVELTVEENKELSDINNRVNGMTRKEAQEKRIKLLDKVVKRYNLQDKVKTGSELQSDNINAKYDAELAALPKNNGNETHYEISGEVNNAKKADIEKRQQEELQLIETIKKETENTKKIKDRPKTLSERLGLKKQVLPEWVKKYDSDEIYYINQHPVRITPVFEDFDKNYLLQIDDVNNKFQMFLDEAGEIVSTIPGTYLQYNIKEWDIKITKDASPATTDEEVANYIVNIILEHSNISGYDTPKQIALSGGAVILLNTKTNLRPQINKILNSKGFYLFEGTLPKGWPYITNVNPNKINAKSESNEIIPQESETALPEDILQQISNNALFKLESQHYTTKLWNQKEGQKWLKDKFGEEAIVLSQEEINDLADRLGYVAQRGGKNLWGFVHQGIVYMSELAPESVHRHEAYHLIHNYVLTDSERRAIEKFGTEEEIADAFMEYMQTEDAPYAAWKRVFKKIYLFFKRILALDKMTLDEFFWTFENSTYNSVSFKKNVEVFRPKVEEIHPTIKKQRIRLINKIFLTALGDLKKDNPNLKTEDLFRLALGKEDLYGTKVMDRLNEMEINIDNNWKSGFYEDIKLDNGTVIPAEQIYRARKAQIKQLKDNLYKDGKPQQWYYDAVEDLRRYGVFVNTIGGKDVIEGEEDGLETWMKENVKSPAFDSFTFNLKVMLTDIPDAEYVSVADKDKPHVKEYILGNKTVYIKTKRDSFNQTVYMDGDEVYAKLLQHLSDSLSQEDMMNKLEDMSYDYPWAKILYDDLSSENGDYLSGNLNQLKSEMYYRFAQWANTQSIVITPVDGEFRLGYSNEKTLKSNLIREWWDKVNSPSNPLFENKEKQAQTISVLNKLNVSPNSSQKDVAAIVKTMNAVGIETTDEIVKAIIKDNKGQSLQKALVQVVEGNKKGVEIIAGLIKKFYPEYYQPSYINVEGEKVQNHIRASFMSRQIEKFNRSEGMEVYEGDPFYNSAYDESVQNVEDALWLDRFKTKKGIISFNLVDGFGGVSSKTFADFTPLEFLAYQMGAFYNNGNHKVKSNSENGQAYYSVQLFADSSSHSLIGMETYSKKDILTKLTQVAFNEYDAIQEGVNGVKGYTPKFNFFPFFNQMSESELADVFSNRESVKRMIEKNVTEWIKKEKRTLGEKGFYRQIKDRYEFLDNRIDNVDEFLEDFYWNDIYAQTQIISLFYGNLSYYNKINNFYKRAKEIWAPGDFLDTTRINKEYFIAIVPDSETTNQEVVDFVNKHLEGVGVRYENSSETDGQGIIDIDRWREIQLGKGVDLDWVNGIYDRVAQGVETETDMEYIFMPYKPFMYDLVKHNGQVVPLQVKNSEVVLLPSMAKNNPKLQTILNKLKEVREKTGLNGSLQFDTTVKVGEHNSNKSVETIDNWITLKNSEYRIQGETPEHQVDADNLLGTQLRKIATGDLELDGDYHVGEESIKGKAIKEEMNSILKADVEANAKSLRERFKSKEEFYKSLQEEAISRNYPKKIIDALEPVVKPDGTVGTKLPLYHPLLIKKAFALIASLYRNKITKLKFPGASLPNVTSYGLERKPQVVFNEDGSIQHLECYMPMTNRWLRDYMDKNGFLNVNKLAEFGLDLGVAYRIPTEGKYSMVPIKVIGFTNAGIILPPEITKMTGLDFDIDKMYVMLYSFDIVGGKPVRTKWYTEGSFDAYKQYLKEKANRESKEHMYKISQNERERIEEELDAMWESHFNEYREITSPVFKAKLKELKSKLKDSNVGHTIDALYEENSSLMRGITKEMKTSYTDVREWLNEEKVYGIERTEEFVKLIVQFKEETQSSRVQATLDQILINLETIMMLQGIQQEHIKSFVERSKVAFKEGLIKSADEKLSPIRTSVWDSFEKKHYGFLAKFNNEISFEDFEKNFNPFQHNTKKARDNRKLDLLRAVLTSPHTFKSQMDGGNFDALEKLAHEVGGEFPNVNPLLASERSRVFENMMAGKALIGIGANYVATHQLMQDQNIELVEPLEFDGRVASDLGAKYVTGTNDIVTAALAQFNASFVDNGKNPLAGLYNMNTYTADVAMLFTKLFGWEAAVRFISHPAVKDFYTRYVNAGGDFKAEQKVIDEIFPQVRFTGEKRRKPLPLTMDMLMNKTDGQDVLYAFIYYKKNQAKQLGDLVTAMKVADTGMSSTVEDTLVSLDAIEKAKKNDGIGGVVQYFENESLHTTSMVNLGIIEPLDRLRDELEFPDYRQGAYKEIRDVFNSEKESGKLNAKEIRFIHDVMMNFMASSFDMFKFNRKAMVKSILPIIEKAKKDNPDNSSKYRKLLSSIKTSASREDSGLQILKLDNGISYNAENDIMEQWEMMFSDSSLIPETDITYSRFAKALVKYAFITKGFRFGPGSFSQVTPINFYAELKNEGGVSFTDYIGGMIRLANSDSQSMNNFISQIVRNYFPRLSFVRTIDPEQDVIKKDAKGNIVAILADERHAKNEMFPLFVKYKDDNKKWHLFQNEFENKYVPVTPLGLYNEVEEWDAADSNPSSDFRQPVSKDVIKATTKISSDYKPVATPVGEAETKDVDLSIKIISKKLFNAADKTLKKGSVVEYNGKKYLFWNENQSGKAQLINTDGTKFSGTPNVDKLTVIGSYPTVMYNNTEYIVTDNNNVYSGATGNLVYTGVDNSSKVQKQRIIDAAKEQVSATQPEPVQKESLGSMEVPDCVKK